MRQIIRRIINLVPARLRNYTLFMISKSDPFVSVMKENKKIVVMLGADYGNLGDVAITESQVRFLGDTFPEHDVIEVPISRTYRDMKALKSKLNEDDIVTIVGGGNTGSLYPEIEEQRRFIIKSFPRNRIIGFPQSAFYGQDFRSKKMLNKSKSIYSNHPDLTMLARDERSLSVFLNDLSVKSGLLPDIVLSTPDLDQKSRKNIAVVSVRSDKEAGLSLGDRSSIMENLKKLNLRAIERDTDIGSTKLTIGMRNSELSGILNAYLGAKLVVTDRLHGMIFCVITRTPCIAFDNNNGKVLGAYKLWVESTSYVRIIDSSDIDNIEIIARSLIGASDVSRKSLKSKFDELKDILIGKKKRTYNDNSERLTKRSR